MKIRKFTRRAKTEWVLDYRAHGLRVRKWFATRALAESAAEMLRLHEDRVNAFWLSLSSHERAVIVEAALAARLAGHTLDHVWKEFQRLTSDSSPAVLLGAAVAEIIAAKRAAQRREGYVRNLQQMLRQFARGMETKPLKEISLAHVEAWILAGRSVSDQATRSSRLSTFFSWAVRRGYLERNPCDRLERIHVEDRAPRILSVEECAAILRATQAHCPRALAWLVLALFAGIRPQEVDRLTWADVDLENGTVRIEAAASKVRRQRIVNFMPAALSWVRWARQTKARLPLPRSTRRRWLRSLRPVLQVARWPQDILRHTCASYWLGHWQDAGRVAHELGNSAGILLRRYRRLVSKRESLDFWNLRPRKK